jgi:hypothetical protein
MSEHKPDNLLEQIKSGEIKMRPRSYFIAKATLQLIALLLAALLAVFFLSFLVFRLKLSGALLMPGFGVGGIKDLLLSLPLFIVVLVLLFLAVFIWFAERYPIAYQRPLLYSLMAIVIMVCGGAVLVYNTPLHPYFFRAFSPPGAPPVMRMLYLHPRGAEIHNGLVGEIRTVDENMVELLGPEDKVYIVLIDPQTFLPAGRDDWEVGDWLIIRGEITGNRIRAWAAREIEKPEFFLEDELK